MKLISVIFYVIGSVLFIISCFVSGITATWWLGGSAVLALILGCVFQFQAYKVNSIWSKYMKRNKD